MWYLKQVNIFNGMTAELGAKVEEMTVMESFEKGDKIFLGVDPAEHLYILKEGRVKIGQNPDGNKELIKAILYPGEIFGENGLTGAENYSDEATALDNRVLVCAMKVSHLEMLMEMHPALGLSVTTSLGQKLARMERKLESLIFKDAHGRIVDFLLHMAQDHGTANNGEMLIQHNLTHQDMANLTATSRQTVTTILNTLRDSGVIRMERKKIFVEDMEALKDSGVETV